MALAYVDISMNEFDDDDLVEELERRGYQVFSRKDSSNNIQDVIDWYKRGNIKEALIHLERVFPELHNIYEKVKRDGT